MTHKMLDYLIFARCLSLSLHLIIKHMVHAHKYKHAHYKFSPFIVAW